MDIAQGRWPIIARLYRRPVGYFTGEETAEVAHLARAASKLSKRDRDELTRFAEYLKARSMAEKE